MTRLDLLIPARNAEAGIGRLLISAQRENTFDEIFVYDDASDDGTRDEARRHGAVVVRGEAQVGPAAAKNCLAEQSSADWVHFHDAHGELAPAFTDRSRRWIAEVDCEAVLFANESRDEVTGARVGRVRWDEEALGADPVQFHIAHGVANCGIYRRRAFLAAGGFDEDVAVRYHEDQAMHLRLALAGCRFRADPHVGSITYRPAAGSMTAIERMARARGQIEVLSRAAGATGNRYSDVIGTAAWRLAAVCAGDQDWPGVDRCLAVAARIGYVDPRHEHWLVRAVARLDAAAAVRFREAAIRLLRPSRRLRTPIAVQPLEGHVR
ncbi:MAG TPA: glycosyltransferase family A protein [Vicinamibacterales bacterium]|nr:glycosyltransferase family A protein [Vicinamibacterales bacterium]